ncbi:MAG: hypothetical protein JNM43_14630 [Planctomycetaceae bacterium]|nr:hypothetical protein [Planctomycetaceae bacterium]
MKQRPCHSAELRIFPRQRFWSILALLLLSAVPELVMAQEWGHLRGQFVLKGEVPVPVTLDIERDAEVCGKVGLVDESLIVNKDNRGIRFVAVWLDSKTAVPTHPDLKDLSKPVTLDNKDCRFEPRMAALRTGQKLVLTNSDPLAHNAAVYLNRSSPFNEVIASTTPVERIVKNPETLPARVDCSIHAWMKAWLVVTEHPYVAFTDADGKFEMKNVPVGTWRFRLWQERRGSLVQVIRNGTEEKLDKGALSVEIRPGEYSELGTIEIPLEQLVKKK